MHGSRRQAALQWRERQTTLSCEIYIQRGLKRCAGDLKRALPRIGSDHSRLVDETEPLSSGVNETDEHRGKLNANRREELRWL